jgi:hypothetical protein
MSDLPPEALEKIEEFRVFIRHKYKDYYKNKKKANKGGNGGK